MKCEYCGRLLTPGVTQCPGCGAAIEQKDNKVEDYKEQASSTMQTPPVQPAGNQTVTGQQEYMEFGGFWRRVVAAFIDSCILGVVAATGIGVIACFIYFPLCEAFWDGSTIGKKAMGLKVVNYNFETITIGQAFGRYFAKFLSTIALYLGFIMVAFSSKKQGLHDKLASTYVVHVRRGIAVNR